MTNSGLTYPTYFLLTYSFIYLFTTSGRTTVPLSTAVFFTVYVP